MSRIRFGAFLAPHHPIGEHPTLQFRRDLDLAAHLDQLGFDEFWCGEHHSSGWETIASPELFLAAAGERTHTIRLGTGVVSLPYHHPFNVAQRIVQLDHMTRGRAILGTGPGALPSDAHMLGIDPMVQRDRQDEALGVILRLLRGEPRFTYESDWFTLRDAALQLLPLQEDFPVVVASSVSPSGMTLAGKYGVGVISIGSNSTAGLQALPTQWAFAEEAATRSGMTVNRADWRVLLSFHIAETRDEARRQARHGLQRWHNEYTVETLQRPGAVKYATADEAVDQLASGGGGSVIGTPDDLVKAIRDLQAVTGGFGTVIGFVHDWANRQHTFDSWELVARYVIPEINRMTVGFRASQRHLIENRESFERAGQAVMAKIMSHEGATRALKEGAAAQAMPGHNAPDLRSERQKTATGSAAKDAAGS